MNKGKTKFYNFLDSINCDLEIIRISKKGNHSGFSVHIHRCEIKEGNCLVSEYGHGDTVNEAIQDYIKKIIGKKIVIHAFTDFRKEYIVPENIYFENN